MASGTALVLRGANGIGKTTLLRTLAGLQEPLAGRIEVPREDLIYASHADGVKAALSVEENLAFWAEVYGRPLDGAVFGTFDLEDLRGRLAGTLSAGQKRRLGLARLGVADRRIWLLDEPTVSLDRASVAAFEGVLRAHLAAGGSVIIATHIDLLGEAEVLELEPFRAAVMPETADEAFL